jgi:hypothetical protein
MADPEAPAFRAARRCSSAIREGNTIGNPRVPQIRQQPVVVSRAAFEHIVGSASTRQRDRRSGVVGVEVTGLETVLAIAGSADRRSP